MTPEEVRQIIREELQEFLASDRYIFIKNIQILEGRNIQVGTDIGTILATTTLEKLAFHGSTPVIQASAITAPASPGVTYLQAEAITMESAVNAIRVALANKGITA